MSFKDFNFLASADIKTFGRTCLLVYMLLLIGLALFLHPRCFCLAATLNIYYPDTTIIAIYAQMVRSTFTDSGYWRHE